MKEQVLEIFNNELVNYIIEILAIFFSVLGGVFVIFRKVKELFEKANVSFKSATDNTEKTNTKLDAVTEDNRRTRKEVKDIEERLFKRLEEQEAMQKEAFAKQEEILESYIKHQETLLKLPKAFAEMVTCTPEQVKNGVARKVCDTLGMNDTNVDIAEKQNGGE